MESSMPGVVYPGNIASSQPKLTGAHRADVVIIGAGLFGLTTALELARGGVDVVVVEARHVGFGASSRNGGQVLTGWRWSQKDIVKRFGKEQGQRLFDIAVAGRDAVKQRAQDYGVWSGGSMTIADKRKHESKLRSELDFDQSEHHYHGAEWLDKKEVEAITGSPVGYGGVRDLGAGFIDSPAYLKGLRRDALAAGVRLYEESPVVRITPHDGARGIESPSGVTIHTPLGHVEADRWVVACNGYIGKLVPRLQRRVFPFTAINSVTRPMPPDAVERMKPFWEAGHCVTGTNFSVNYFRPLAGHRLGFGGGEIWQRQGTTNVADATRILTKHFRYQYPHAARLLEDEGCFEHVWSGKIAVTPNRLPAIGAQGSMHYAIGFSGLGIAITAAVALVVSKHIMQSMEHTSTFDPAKARDDHALLSTMSRSSFPPLRWTVELAARIYIAQDKFGS